MRTLLLTGLPCVLLAGCADTPDSRYRDIKHLELPPILAIEHHPQPAAETPAATAASSTKKKSVLEGIAQLIEKDGKQQMQLKTRPERAWELTDTALQLAGVEILDKNRSALSFKVRFDPDGKGFMAWLNDQYQTADYAISVKEELAGTTVQATLINPETLEVNQEPPTDSSNALMEKLHSTLQEKVINRAGS